MQKFEQTNALCYQTAKLDRDLTPPVIHNKIVLFEAEEGAAAQCSIFLNGFLFKKKWLSDRADPLAEIFSRNPCARYAPTVVSGSSELRVPMMVWLPLEPASPLERGSSSRLLAAMAVAAEELCSMSLALTQPRYPGGLSSGKCGGWSSGHGGRRRRPRRWSQWPRPLHLPGAATRTTTALACPTRIITMVLHRQRHPPQSPPPPPLPPPPPQPLPPSPPVPPSSTQTRFNGTSPGLLVEVGSPPPLVNGVVACDRKEECSAPQ
ncbi:hypothetical protein MRX96_018793 [Rhipicephalus microplus]